MAGKEEGVHDPNDGVRPERGVLVLSETAHVERVELELVSDCRELCNRRIGTGQWTAIILEYMYCCSIMARVWRG